MAITMVGFCTYVLRMDAACVARLFRTSYSQHARQELGLLRHAQAPAHDVSSKHQPLHARTIVRSRLLRKNRKNQAMGGRNLEKTGEALNKQLLSIAWRGRTRDRRHIHPTRFHFQPPSEVS